MDSIPSLSGGEGDSTAYWWQGLSGLSIVSNRLCHWRRSRRGLRPVGEAFAIRYVGGPF